MSATDVPNSTAMIFTEADIYILTGYLSVIWGVEKPSSEMVRDTEQAIRDTLRFSNDYGRHLK